VTPPPGDPASSLAPPGAFPDNRSMIAMDRSRWPLLCASLLLATTAQGADYVADGRLPAGELLERVAAALAPARGWATDTVYAYPGDAGPPLRAWHTTAKGPALWLLAGIHGEEPAGPNAIAASLGRLLALADAGVPIVLVPLCNPRGYQRNWRYPNTAERDWRKGGYSVGDAEYLLPDLERGDKPRAAAAPGPETRALTAWVLRLAAAWPPRLVLDLHEDELSTAGGYIYSQGQRPADSPVGVEVIRLLEGAGIPIRREGLTRFGEPIEAGMISHDDQGRALRDGSIDELLAAREVFRDRRRVPGPAARTVIVVETPAFAGSRFELRVAGQRAVLEQLPALWRLNAAQGD
jgi:hypothetical protein